MVFDVHGHQIYERLEETHDEVLEVCRTYGVDKVFISTLISIPSGYIPTPDEVECCNTATWNFMREQPGLIEGMVYLNPRNADSLDVLRRGIEQQGMKGIKLWIATFCDDPLVDPIAEAAARYDVPILVHAFKKVVGQLEYETRAYHMANLARRHPKTKFIMAHLGANAYYSLKCIRPYPNVWVDFSGSIYRRDDIDYTVETLGVDRVLFGSDMPGMFDDCLGQVEGATLTPGEKEKVLWRNCAGLFKLDVKGADG